MAGAIGERREASAAQALARIVYSARALSSLERAFEFLAGDDHGAAAAAVVAIRDAVGLLATQPLIGRRTEGGLRELVISYGKTGYIALYWVSRDLANVQVLAVRHQRELDYPA
jgi:plasmid stabilization system protein ParE